jgi:3-hydroxyisobutyrate dehydrogenase-like beta-hydroxyacid dehydrogenase
MRPAVGWIGLGRIGMPMARRVLGAGWRLHVWARRPEAAQALVAQGARWVETPEQLARACDRLVTIVGDSDDVLSIHRRLLPQACAGTVCLEMTTAAPVTATTMSALAAGTNVAILDCPVTGGVSGAQQGSLTTFVGGDAEALERAHPLLAVLCQRIVHCGAHGAGYRMKLVNQTMVAGTLLGLAEGAALARANGFDAALVQQALGSGTASGFLFQSYVQRMLEGDGAVTFTLALLRKDLLLARDEAIACHVETQLLDRALDAVQAASQRFGAHAGVQCLSAAARSLPSPSHRSTSV